MSDQEKALLKAFLHYVVDNALPSLINAEVAKLPAVYSAIVGEVVKAAEPGILASVDAAIDAKLA